MNAFFKHHKHSIRFGYPRLDRLLLMDNENRIPVSPSITSTTSESMPHPDTLKVSRNR
jgi:hypothetical protein